MNEHRCKKIKLFDSNEDTCVKVRSIGDNWVLHRFLLADKKWVYDGEAQYVGEILSIYDLSINYCPYCGDLLNKNMSSTKIFSELINNGSCHKCKNLEEYNRKYPHVGFGFDIDAEWRISKDSEVWHLERYSTAPKRMVIAQEAERNELVFWHGMSIDFCPFCGQELQN